MTRFPCTAAVAAVVLATIQPVAAQRGPAAAESGLSADVVALACAPTANALASGGALRVSGGQDSFTRRNYAPGDLVTINGGRANGLEVGQQFFIRRIQIERGERIEGRPQTVHTAGWLRVYAVDETMSLATVTHACDSIEVGDYLEPFTVPQPVAPSRDRAKPERDHYARVMSGVDLRHTFGRGDFFVINRGSSEGVTPGAQFVVYRDKGEKENFLFELGEAVAVSVTPQTSTLQVTVSRDAFSDGDYVAMRPAASPGAR